MLFGKKIRELRDEQGVLQRQLAALLDTYVQQDRARRQTGKARTCNQACRIPASGREGDADVVVSR